MARPKITLKKIEQEIDLEDIFGIDVSDDESLKIAFGQVLIDKMVARAESGIGYDGVKLKSPYSNEYANSLEFKAAGKSKGKITMTLTGDMLGSLDVKEKSGSKIKITVGEDQTEKAFNHLTGDTVPKRPWFGFSKAELKEIAQEFGPKIKKAMDKGPDGKDILLKQLNDEIQDEES